MEAGGITMGKGIFASVPLIALLASNAASAADLSVLAPSGAVPYAWGYPAPYPKDWDKRIGYDFWTRLVNYYALEMGHDAPPPDPAAPPGRRPRSTPAPQSTPALSLHRVALR